MTLANFTHIMDHEGNPYLMSVNTKGRFGVERVLLSFENEDEELNSDYDKFELLEIDTRFHMFVDLSIYCDVPYINNILRYICENQQQIRNTLKGFLSEEEINSFLSGIRPRISTYDIENTKNFPVYPSDDIPRMAYGTAKKRFFVLNENNNFREVSFHTATEIFGRDELREKCQELEFVNALESNGRAFWLNGLGIQDVDRDRYNGGWCQ